MPAGLVRIPGTGLPRLDEITRQSQTDHTGHLSRTGIGHDRNHTVQSAGKQRQGERIIARNDGKLLKNEKDEWSEVYQLMSRYIAEQHTI